MKENTKIDIINDLKILASQISSLQMPSSFKTTDSFKLLYVPATLRGCEYSDQVKELFFLFNAEAVADGRMKKRGMAWNFGLVQASYNALTHTDVKNDVVRWNTLQVDAAVTFSKITGLNARFGLPKEIIDNFQKGVVDEQKIMPYFDMV